MGVSTGVTDTYKTYFVFFFFRVTLTRRSTQGKLGAAEVKRSKEDNAAGSPSHRFCLSLCARLRTRKQRMGRGKEDWTPNHRLALERSATEISS